MKVAIIGMGVVGKNIEKLLAPKNECVFHDPRLGFDATQNGARYPIAVVCVPTDMRPDGSVDTSIVEEVVRTFPATLFVIKSTVPPGTCRKLSGLSGGDIVFSPEYYGGTQHANTPHDFAIFGGYPDDCRKAVQLWQSVFTGYNRIFCTDWETAELIKYAENTWLAMQVTYAVTFWRICKDLGLDYTNFRELLLLDERISRSHTFVYDEHPYYDSHCLNKDLPGLEAWLKTQGRSATFVSDIIQRNAIHRAQGDES